VLDFHVRGAVVHYQHVAGTEEALRYRFQDEVDEILTAGAL
jgi:hypothetical protein